MDEEFVANSFVRNDIVKLLNEFVTDNMKTEPLVSQHPQATNYIHKN